MAEGGGLLNRYTVKSRIGGSNPPLSATPAEITNTDIRMSPVQYWVYLTCALQQNLCSFLGSCDCVAASDYGAETR